MPEPIQSYWELVGPIFSTIDTASPTRFFTSIEVLSRPIVLLYAAHFCLSEVRNGGFLQFFWNSTGVMAPEAAEGFDMIGMHLLAAVTTEAVGLLGSPYPRDRDERWDMLLVASGRDGQALEELFENATNFYLAFEEATEPLGFGTLNRQAWALAKTETGGFEEAATRYAQRHS